MMTVSGYIKASGPSSVMILLVHYHDPFLQKMERALCVWLEDEAESVSGWRPCQWRIVWKLYLTSKNLAFRVLLVLANAPGHPQDLALAQPNVQVKYLSSTITSFLKLLSQQIIMACRSFYTCHTLCIILDASEKETFVSVSECWKL